LAQLSHPNVVTVHDVGTVDDQVFLAMELVEGKTLREWLCVEKRSWRNVIRVFQQAGKALAAAHSLGIVHRDFKPENAIVAESGRVCVVDFGLARAERCDTVDRTPLEQKGTLGTTVTRTGAFVGTPAYMAPEQRAGKGSDARSDQFSFCVALFEA